MTAAAKPEIRTAERSTSLRVSQGDVFADVKYIESASVINGEFVVTGVEYPLVVVLSQDCDLQQDYLFRLGVQKEGPPDKRLVFRLASGCFCFLA